MRSPHVIDGRHRWVWLVGGVVVAGIVVLVPLRLAAPAQEPAGLALIQLIVCGVILGLGRQGIDVLLLRLFTVSLVPLVGISVGIVPYRGPVCSGPLDCLQAALIGIVAFGFLGTAVLVLVALPTSLLWNRGVGGWKPEVHLPMPQTWWQVLLVVLALSIAVILLAVLLGITWPG